MQPLMAGINPSWLATARTHTEFTRRLSGEFAASLPGRMAGRRAMLKKIAALLEDPDPDATIALSESHPFPFFDSSYVQGPVTPEAKWRQVASGTKFWPRPVQDALAALMPDPRHMPRWDWIRKVVALSGYEAFPVHGYVGVPVYSYLIDEGRVPVCTHWVIRYRKAPYYCLPADILHDLGHALGLLQPDYREVLSAYSLMALRQPKYLSSDGVSRDFSRFFEFSHSRSGAAYELIGAGPMAFETLRPRGSRLERVGPEPDSAVYRPFRSRDAWKDSVLRKVEEIG
jgi:hypothetical protein